MPAAAQSLGMALHELGHQRGEVWRPVEFQAGTVEIAWGLYRAAQPTGPASCLTLA